jgi:glycosyltransferase involved in cell wall biosynthesis
VLVHFKASDLFVLGCEIAENGDRDGIPNVLVESLAMGVPALSTNVSAIPEILIDGKTGMTVPPSQPELFEEAMIRMLTDQKLRKKLIAGGQERVKDTFDNSLWIQRLAEIFREHNAMFRQN